MFIRHLLTNDQKQQCVNVCLEERRLTRTQLLSIGLSWVMKLDLRLWSRNKSTITAVEEPTITKSKKRVAGPDFNKEHAHCFSFLTRRGLFIVNLFLLTLWATLTFTVTFWKSERKCVMRKTGTLAQPQLAPLQRARPHVPENHGVCDSQQHGYWSPFSLLAGLSPLWFHFVSHIENEPEGMTF
jgi:hypothetical protein